MFPDLDEQHCNSITSTGASVEWDFEYLRQELDAKRTFGPPGQQFELPDIPRQVEAARKYLWLRCGPPSKATTFTPDMVEMAKQVGMIKVAIHNPCAPTVNLPASAGATTPKTKSKLTDLAPLREKLERPPEGNIERKAGASKGSVQAAAVASTSNPPSTPSIRRVGVESFFTGPVFSESVDAAARKALTELPEIVKAEKARLARNGPPKEVSLRKRLSSLGKEIYRQAVHKQRKIVVEMTFEQANAAGINWWPSPGASGAGLADGGGAE